MAHTLIELTPAKFHCDIGTTCPAKFKTEEGTYLLIGKAVDPSEYTNLKSRIGPDEALIEVPAELIDDTKG